MVSVGWDVGQFAVVFSLSKQRASVSLMQK